MEHPSAPELSAFVDGLLSARQTAVTSAHLEACLGCAHELSLLRSAREVLLQRGRPVPPAGAEDSAVVAAMASVARAARDAAQPGALPITTAAATPASSPESSAARPEARPAGDVSARRGQPAPAGSVKAAPWMPQSWDAEQSKRRALARHRQLRVATRAAVVVLILGALGGAGYAVAHSYAGRSGASSAATSMVAGSPHYGTTGTGPNSTQPSSTVVQPPIGTFALQLRGEIGPAPCSRVASHVDEVNGELIVVNPPAGQSAVMALPSAAGQPGTCVSVGPAFATAWSGDVSKVTVTPTAASPPATAAAGPVVDVTIGLKSGAVSDEARFQAAVGGRLTVEVIGRGTDYGTAVVEAGQVFVLRVSKSVVTFLTEQLTKSPS